MKEPREGRNNLDVTPRRGSFVERAGYPRLRRGLEKFRRSAAGYVKVRISWRSRKCHRPPAFRPH